MASKLMTIILDVNNIDDRIMEDRGANGTYIDNHFVSELDFKDL